MKRENKMQASIELKPLDGHTKAPRKKRTPFLFLVIITIIILTAYTFYSKAPLKTKHFIERHSCSSYETITITENHPVYKTIDITSSLHSFNDALECDNIWFGCNEDGFGLFMKATEYAHVEERYSPYESYYERRPFTVYCEIMFTYEDFENRDVSARVYFYDAYTPSVNYASANLVLFYESENARPSFKCLTASNYTDYEYQLLCSTSEMFATLLLLNANSYLKEVDLPQFY